MAQLFSFPFVQRLRVLTLLVVAGLLVRPAHAQSVGIGTGGTPDPQAALDIRSAEKGLLIPRLDSVQRAALTPPTDGLMVFQKDGRVGLWYAFGGTWFYIPDKVKAGDNLGSHTATRVFNLQNQLLVGASTLNGTPSTTGLRIDGLGRVGIATDGAGPAQLLHLGSITSGRPAFLRVGGGNGTAYRQWEMGMTLNPANLGDATGENYDFAIRDVTANQTRLLIDYANGRVGIGTPTPANALHVIGGARFSEMAGTGQRLLTVNSTGDLVASATIPAGIPGDNLGDHLARQPLQFDSNDDDKILFIDFYGTNGPKISHSFGWNLDYYAGSTGGTGADRGTHRFFSGGVAREERMRLTATGRLGIGTPAPATTLHVEGNARISSLAGTGSRFLTANPTGDLLASTALLTGSTGQLQLAQPLEFLSADADKILFIESYGVDGPKLTHSTGWNLDYYAGPVTPGAPTQGTHRFFSGGASRQERMRLTASGRLGIGTTAPRGPLDVAAPGNLYLTANPADGGSQVAFLPGNLYLAPFNAGTPTSIIQARVPSPTATTNLGLQFSTTSNGAVRNVLKLDPDGKVGIGTTTPAQTLDVIGTVQAQAYRYAAPQTRYLSIPATAFTAVSPAYHPDYTWLGGGAPIVASFVSLTGGTAGQPGSLVAPVNLPQGAILTGLELSAVDQDNTPVAPSATLWALNNQAALQLAILTQLTAESANPQTVSQAFTHTVLNDTNAYSLTVQLNQNSPDTRLVCVRIAYTVQQPD